MDWTSQFHALNQIVTSSSMTNMSYSTWTIRKWSPSINVWCQTLSWWYKFSIFVQFKCFILIIALFEIPIHSTTKPYVGVHQLVVHMLPRKNTIPKIHVNASVASNFASIVRQSIGMSQSHVPNSNSGRIAVIRKPSNGFYSMLNHARDVNQTLRRMEAVCIW